MLKKMDKTLLSILFAILGIAIGIIIMLILNYFRGNSAKRSADSIIEKAKKEQVPADVIQRSIDKVNKGVGEDYTVCEYEAFGPAGSNMIIKCLTDNVNRTVAAIKTVANKSAAKIATQGAVSFMYENLCVLGVKGKSEDEVMEALINGDVDVNDICGCFRFDTKWYGCPKA